MFKCVGKAGRAIKKFRMARVSQLIARFKISSYLAKPKFSLASQTFLNPWNFTYTVAPVTVTASQRFSHSNFMSIDDNIDNSWSQGVALIIIGLGAYVRGCSLVEVSSFQISNGSIEGKDNLCHPFVGIKSLDT